MEEKKKRKKSHIPQPGEQFGRLTVLYKCEDKHVTPRGYSFSKYHVKCSCENHTEFDVLGISLTSGNTRSCGCLNKEYAKKVLVEKARQANIKRNPYIKDGKNIFDLTGEYGKGTTTNGDEFLFDKEDYEKIKDKLWFSKNSSWNRFYVCCKINSSTIYMHRYILGLQSHKEDKRDVDHINHNTLDNRKENLRVCEHYQNTTSQKTRSDNISGRKGVSWDKFRNKWAARITYNNKKYFLGRFDNFEDAVKAREKAEKEIHGEFNYSDKEKLNSGNQA